MSVELSVVVPCMNEEGVLDALVGRLTAVCRGVGLSYEIVLVNDGSTDATWPMMQSHASADPHLVCVNLSRNHGHQLALTAGLSVASGEVIFVLDADLQDPPEALPDMLTLLHSEAADVVYGQRLVRRRESAFKRLTAWLFYRALDRVSDVSIPADAGDFRLMSRRVVDLLLQMPERRRYLRGMISWLGFRQVPYRYDRHERLAGETKYTLRKMLCFAGDAVTGFSVKPLTWPFVMAGVAMPLSMIVAAVAVWGWGSAWAGWLGLAALVGGLAGLQFFALGVMGQYLGRLVSESHSRPLFVIDRVVRGQAAGRREAA